MSGGDIGTDGIVIECLCEALHVTNELTVNRLQDLHESLAGQAT